jgi:glutamate synthase (NADPH/NADH) small chain
VIQALDLLKEVNLALLERRDCEVNLGDQVVVIGGGNAAIDGAVVARKLGAARVTILYRRSEQEMTAWEKERQFALSQGVVFHTLTQPVRFLGDRGKLTEVECLRVQLGEVDDSGRRRPIPLAGTEFRIACDRAIVAIGQRPGPGLDGLKRDPRGLVEVEEETLVTSVQGIYAGGDLIRGSDTAVRAVGDGKRAALAMDAWIQGGH